MRKIQYTVSFLFFISSVAFSQDEPLRIEGYVQGTTYHITYFDSLNRNLQPDIEKILHDFDNSVSTYVPSSII